MPNEHDLTNAASDWLDRLKREGQPIWWMKVHGGRFQKSKVSDYLLCIQGRFVAIELKHPDEPPEPEPGQVNRLLEVQRARGVVRVFNSLDSLRVFVLGALKDWGPKRN
jgi:hypothetical protein